MAFRLSGLDPALIERYDLKDKKNTRILEATGLARVALFDLIGIGLLGLLGWLGLLGLVGLPGLP